MAQRALLLVVVALLCRAAAVAGRNADWDNFAENDLRNLCGSLEDVQGRIQWRTNVPYGEFYDKFGSYRSSSAAYPSCKWEYHHTHAIGLVLQGSSGGTVTIYNDTHTFRALPSKPLVVEVNGWAGITYQTELNDRSPSFSLRVGPADWTTNAGRRTQIQSEDAHGSFECANGGALNSVRSAQLCHCPPGFAGPNCLRACGPDRYGTECEKRCSGTLRGCEGLKFSRMTSNAITVESCAAGFSGPLCATRCRKGTYGADCDQTCGQCDGGASCDPYKGLCPGSCEPGFEGPSCKHELLYLADGLNITSATETSISGSVTISPDNVAGRGSVKYLEVQTKESDKGDWQPGARQLLRSLDKCTLRADAKSVETSVTTIPQDCTYDFTVTGLRRDISYDVRALLLDDKHHSFTDVPYVMVTTSGQRRAQNPAIASVTSTSMHINWTAVATDQSPVFVSYECLRLEWCDAPCPAQASPATQLAERGALQQAEGGEARVALGAVLQGLTPAARYRVRVSDEEDAAYVEATTLPAAPSAGVTGLHVERLTNSSAALRWDRLRCGVDAVHGPVLGYRWLLSTNDIISDDDDSNSSSSLSKTEVFTAEPMAVPWDLEPLTSYKLSVAVVNGVGAGPDTQIEFTTLPTVPDAPRDLSAYRFNRTSLWLRWRPPARPSGALRHYTLTAQPVAAASAKSAVQRPAREERVNASTAACAAYPGWVCASLHRLRPGEYALAVSATNEHADQPGQRAEISFSTAAALRTASPPPRQLEAWRVTADSVWLRWRQPESFRSDPFYFQVKVIRQLGDADADASSSADLDLVADPEPTRVHVDEEKEVYEFVADHLQPNTKYQVEVGCGYGGIPATVDITTAEAPSTAPASSDAP